MKFLRLILVLFGCLHLGGGSYGIAQVLAWTSMAIQYSAEKGIQTGLRETFDGAHPCEMCHAIAEQKKRDSSKPEPAQQSERAAFELKNQIPPTTPQPGKIAWKDTVFQGFPDPASLFPSPRPAPEMPPPRIV